MPLASPVQAMKPGDHFFAIGWKHRPSEEKVLVEFVRTAIASGGEVRLLLSGPRLRSVRDALGAALPAFRRWEGAELVAPFPPEPLVAAFSNPSLQGIEAFGGSIEKEWREAERRGRSSLWLMSGLGAQLLETGDVGRALFAEMYLHGQHQLLPLATLCLYPDPVDGRTLEGLRGTHNGFEGSPQ